MNPMDSAWLVLKRSKPWHSDDFLPLAHRASEATDALRAVTDYQRHTWEGIAPQWAEFKDAVLPLAQARDIHNNRGRIERGRRFRDDEVQRIGNLFADYEEHGEQKDELKDDWWHRFFNPSMMDDDLRAGREWAEQQGEGEQ